MRLCAVLIGISLSSPCFGVVAFDAISNSGGTDTTTFSWTHTPSGTPKGVLVLIYQEGNASGPGPDEITGVTYDGEAMTEVANSPELGGAYTRGGVIYAYFLGSGVNTGAVSVEVTCSASTSKKRAVAISLTAAGDTSIVTTNLLTLLNYSGTLSLGGETCYAAQVWFSDLPTVNGMNPLTNWTSRIEDGWTSGNTGGVYTYDVVGSSDITFGSTQSVDHWACLGVAIKDDGGSPLPIFMQQHLRK